jgi:hypothetical protein
MLELNWVPLVASLAMSMFAKDLLFVLLYLLVEHAPDAKVKLGEPGVLNHYQTHKTENRVSGMLRNQYQT